MLQDYHLNMFFSAVYDFVYACGGIRLVLAQTNGVTAHKVICYANS